MTKPIVIVSIIILLGLGYFAWQSNQVSDVNNTEAKSQTEVTNIVNDSSNNLDVKIDENKNKSEAKEGKEKDIISSKSHEIVNPITGETHPTSYYDEVLADGYTYNNPAPIPEDWIIEPATDEYPATLDYDKLKDALSESYIHNGRITKHFTMVPEYMVGYNPRILLIYSKNGFDTKRDFVSWISQYTDANISFVSESGSQIRDGAKNWGILIHDSKVSDSYNLYTRLTTDTTLSIRVSSFYLPQYRGTKELQDAIDATMNAMTE